MSWPASITHVSDQAQARFGDILGNIVYVYQYPRVEPPDNAQIPALCQAPHMLDPHRKRSRLHGPCEDNENKATSPPQMHGSSQHENIHALLRTTYEAALSENAMLHQKMATMYARISELTGHVQRLISALESDDGSQRKRKRKRPIADSFCDSNNDGWDSDNRRTSGATSCVRNVLDNVSIFDSRAVHNSIGKTRQKLSGTPYCPIAQSSSCHAEFYTVATPTHRLFVAHIVQNESSSQTYFLVFQRSDRQWVRAKALITFDRAPKTTAFIRTNVPGNMGSSNCVPDWLKQLSQKLTEKTRTTNVRVNLELKLRDQQDALIVRETTTLSITEDIMARTVSAAEELIQELCGLQIPKVPESALVVLERLTVDHFGVLLNGQMCQFRMAPFTSRTEDMQRFRHRLNCLVRSRGCSGITQLIGLVTDDDEYHVRGYCSRYVGAHAVGFVLSVAKRIARPIDWTIRLQWIRSIVAAAAELHDHEMVIGSMTNVSIHLAPDHQVVVDPTFSYNSTSAKRDCMGAEFLGSKSGTEEAANVPEIGKTADIYQVGLVIWQIAEHQPQLEVRFLTRAFCVKALCTNKPWYLCRADHTRPRELPPCRDVPSLVNDIIRICCSEDWKHRPTAHILLEMLSRLPDASTRDTRLDAEVAWHLNSSRLGVHHVYCDECCKLTSLGIDCHYHCSVCFGDDFDLCQECYEKGNVRCLDPTHRMVKRIVKDDDLHELPYWLRSLRTSQHVADHVGTAAQELRQKPHTI